MDAPFAPSLRAINPNLPPEIPAERVAQQEQQAGRIQSLSTSILSSYLSRSCPDLKLRNDITELKYLLRERVASFPSEAADIADLSYNFLDPILQSVRSRLKQDTSYLALSTAAAKGQALHLGIEATVQIETKGVPLQLSPRSHNYLIECPEEGIILKKTSLRSQEEEEAIDALFALSMKDGLIPTYRLDHMSSIHFGCERIPVNDLSLGYCIEDLSPSMQRALSSKLRRKEDRKLWAALKDAGTIYNEEKALRECFNHQLYELEGYEKALSIYQLKFLFMRGKINPQCLITPIEPKSAQTLNHFLISHENLRTVCSFYLSKPAFSCDPKVISNYFSEISSRLLKLDYFYTKHPCLPWRRLTFQEFIGKLSAKEITGSTYIKVSGSENEMPFGAFLDTHPNFAKALSLNTRKVKHDRMYFVPDFFDAHHRRIYERCSKLQWKVGEDTVLTFKELEKYWLKGKIDEELEVSVNGESATFQIQNDARYYLKSALETQWRLYCPEAKAIIDHKLAPVQRYNVKPFVHMYLLSEFNREEASYDSLMQRLDTDSEFAALLSAEFQMMDLHPGNLGVTINKTDDYRYYAQKKYTFQNVPHLPFSTIHELDLSGLLDHESDIIIEGENGGRPIPIKEIKGLVHALHTTWNLKFFDGDVSLGESSSFHEYTYSKSQTKVVRGHLIPIRSTLFEVSWKDRPLSTETIEKYRDPKRIQRIRDWMERTDSPFRRFLSAECNAWLSGVIQEFIQNPAFSLSGFLEKKQKASIQQIRDTFAFHFSEQPQVWERIERDLNENGKRWFEPYKARVGDTLENIAKCYSTTPAEICRMNPHFRELVPGIHLKVRDNLTLDTESSKSQRILIGKLLFPRLTWHQQKALIERQNKALEYLQFYQELKTVSENPDASLDLLNRMFASSAVPLTFAKRNYLKKRMKDLQQAMIPAVVYAIVDMMITDLKPSYFNMCKSMYPFLGDYYELCCSTNDKPGKQIGVVANPIEKIIEKIKNSHPPNHDLYATALYLEEAIKEHQAKPFRPFFGHFYQNSS